MSKASEERQLQQLFQTCDKLRKPAEDDNVSDPQLFSLMDKLVKAADDITLEVVLKEYTALQGTAAGEALQKARTTEGGSPSEQHLHADGKSTHNTLGHVEKLNRPKSKRRREV